MYDNKNLLEYLLSCMQTRTHKRTYLVNVAKLQNLLRTQPVYGKVKQLKFSSFPLLSEIFFPFSPALPPPSLPCEAYRTKLENTNNSTMMTFSFFVFVFVFLFLYFSTSNPDMGIYKFILPLHMQVL